MSGIINSGNFVSEIPRIFRSFFHHNVFNNMVHIREHSQTFYSDEIDSEGAHFQYCIVISEFQSEKKEKNLFDKKRGFDIDNHTIFKLEYNEN